MSYKRGRMPHNNRVAAGAALKTTDIWSKTIGHDPHSSAAEQASATASAAAAEKARGLLELARHQNLTGGRGNTGGDDFARKMFLGLKGGKKRRGDGMEETTNKLDADTLALLEESSSSEDEADVGDSDQKGMADGKREDSSDSSSSEEERRRRKRKKEKKRSKSSKRRKKEKRRKHSDSDSSDGDSSSEEERRKKKKRKRHHERRRKDRRKDRDGDDRKRRHDEDDDGERKKDRVERDNDD